MRDLALLLHIMLGISLVVLPLVILSKLGKKSSLARTLSLLSAGASWTLLFPAGILYTMFYPATKTLIKSGAWPWAHSVVMETKEHWGLLLPVITTVAAWLVLANKEKESRRWWVLAAVLAALLGVMGRVVKMGALA
ncbi:MAG: hypothetical protein HY516_02115 [Candidatus Aenigmarchaeota archaeon]|nr:hypothetical protein [Candidatus Aenigmarchaeota archaeon]